MIVKAMFSMKFSRVITVVSVLLPMLSFAQLNGPPTVHQGKSYTFNFTEVALVPLECYSWDVSPSGSGSVETVLPYSRSYDQITQKYTTNYNAVLKFTSLGGATVQVKCNSQVVASMGVSIVDGRLQPPYGFSIDYGCSHTTISKLNFPEAGVEWWWQESETGTGTDLGQVTADNMGIKIFLPKVLWLRPKLAGTSTWGYAAPVNGNDPVTVYYAAGSPPVVAHSNAVFKGSSATISVDPVADAINYRWYREDGSVVDNLYTNSYTSAFTRTQTFYVAAVRGCENPTRLPVTITVVELPRIFVQGGGSSDLSGGPVTLATGPYTAYSWMISTSPYTQSSSPTYTVSTPGKYTVRVLKTGVVGSGTSAEFTVGTSQTDKNFVTTNIVQMKGVIDPTAVDGLSIGDKTQTIEYFDGLGRPLQTVVTQGSPLKKDFVQPFSYDEFGREAKIYLPYSSSETNGWIKTDPIGDAAGSYNNGPQYLCYQNVDKVARDINPFTATIFEPSPLSRVRKQGAPGAAWQPVANINSIDDYSIKKDYRVNTNEEVLRFIYEPVTEDVTLAIIPTERFYQSNQLSKNVTLDENNNQTVEFFDNDGRLICKRVQYSAAGNSPSFADTYYVYDDFGSLVMVLPPEGIAEILAR